MTSSFCIPLNTTGFYWWLFNIDSCYGLFLSGNKPLIKAMLIKFYSAIWRYLISKFSLSAWHLLNIYLVASIPSHQTSLWIGRKFRLIWSGIFIARIPTGISIIAKLKSAVTLTLQSGTLIRIVEIDNFDVLLVMVSHHSVSNNWQLDCWFRCFFRQTWKPPFLGEPTGRR